MAHAGIQATASHAAAAREPSMEEILASIRRIIEDSDHTRRAGESSIEDSLPQAFSSIQADDELPELSAFRAELAEVTPFDTTPIAPPVFAQEHFQPSPAPAAIKRTTLDELPQPAPVKTHEVEAKPTATAEPAIQARPAERFDAPAPAPEISTAENVAPMPAAQESEAAARPALISDVASRQVAAAFGELSDVFAASRRRSFDEIAEEMMRPMLQDWLDNNLPILVERLVREEIERVARGGQR